MSDGRSNHWSGYDCARCGLPILFIHLDKPCQCGGLVAVPSHGED